MWYSIDYQGLDDEKKKKNMISRTEKIGLLTLNTGKRMGA